MFKPIIYANTIQSMSLILHAVERLGIGTIFAMQYVRLDLVTAGPWYVVLRSTLKSYYTQHRYF